MTVDPERHDDRVRRVLTVVTDFARRPLDELRILALGDGDGVFATELRRLGADVVTAEPDLPELGGQFDVVLCLGLLHRLGAQAQFRLVARLGERCTGLLVVDTHIGLDDEQLARVDPGELAVDPALALSGMRTVLDDNGFGRRGRVFPGNDGASTSSFWPQRATLLDMLRDAGFSSVYEPVVPPAPRVPADRIWLAAVRGEHRAADEAARRLRAAYRPPALPDPPGPAVPDAVPGALPDIVCLGTNHWNWAWGRPQHMLTRFAQRGHRVFLVEYAEARIASDGEPTYAATEIEARLWLVHPSAPKPLTIADGLPSAAIVTVLHTAIRDLAADFSIGADAVALVYFAVWEPVLEGLRAEHGWTVVYDCMDDWDGWPNVPVAIDEAERRLAASADAVTVSAYALWEKLGPLAKQTVLIRNGGDPSHYHRPVQQRPLAHLARPIIGFVGSIGHWVDVALVARAARERPDWNFALIGPEANDMSALRAQPNIHLEPKRPYELMPAYVRDFDVCLIPFLDFYITDAVDPVKIYEYFALGKPVVSRPMPELRRFGDLVYIAIEPEDFVGAIAAALAESDPDKQQRRREIADEADWHRRIDVMNVAIERSRTRGYDSVRSAALARRLHRSHRVAVVGDPTASADVVRLRPELFAPAAEGADAVLALSLRPGVLDPARRLATTIGADCVHVLTRARGDEVPNGHPDIVDAATVALGQQGLVALDVERLMWSADGAVTAPTALARANGGTRELLLRAVPTSDPATTHALQDQVRGLRQQIDVLVNGR